MAVQWRSQIKPACVETIVNTRMQTRQLGYGQDRHDKLIAALEPLGLKLNCVASWFNSSTRYFLPVGKAYKSVGSILEWAGDDLQEHFGSICFILSSQGLLFKSLAVDNKVQQAAADAAIAFKRQPVDKQKKDLEALVAIWGRWWQFTSSSLLATCLTLSQINMPTQCCVPYRQ